MKVVVVEDQERMRHLVVRYLEEHGVEAVGCADGDAALSTVVAVDPDVLVLDVMLPGLSGTAVCRALRSAGHDVPIIMLTARGEVAERVAGLEAGADDYLVKPFALEELHARVRVLARRRAPASERLEVGDLVVDTAQRRAWVAGTEVALPGKELDVLLTLLDPPGAVASRRRLHDEVWDGLDEDLRGNSLEVYVSRLRQHLRGSSCVRVTTVRGRGYRIDVA